YLDQSIQIADQPMQPPSKRTSKPRLSQYPPQQLSQFPPQHLSQFPAQHLSQHPPQQLSEHPSQQLSQSSPQHTPMQSQQQQQKHQPYHGIYSSVSANIGESPGRPQPMLPATNLEPLPQFDIPSKNHKGQRIADIEDLIRDHDDDNAEFQSKILDCNGAHEAESYRRRIRKGKQAQEQLRRELRALEEDVSLYDFFLILLRWDIPLTQFHVA
ncbi:MAG: hypothetical protein Q9180_008766, partial [Flavoplaca navasiana]